MEVEARENEARQALPMRHGTVGSTEYGVPSYLLSGLGTTHGPRTGRGISVLSIH